jgi:hypothetical protein
MPLVVEAGTEVPVVSDDYCPVWFSPDYRGVGPANSSGNWPLAIIRGHHPAVAFWNNFASTWVIRGGVGVEIPIQGGGKDTLISQLAIGQTLTAHDVPLFGDFTYYLSTVVYTPLSTVVPRPA